MRAGIVLSPAEIIGPLAGFIVLAVLALWVTVAILRPLDTGGQGASGHTAGELREAYVREGPLVRDDALDRVEEATIRDEPPEGRDSSGWSA